jgi:hypothetical protein
VLSRTLAVAAVLSAALALPSVAQAPLSSRFPTPQDRSTRLQALEREATLQPGRRAAREEDEAAKRQREFTARMAEFANCWNKLILGAQKGTWNAKAAAKTRKAFERLVHSQGWIEEGKDSPAER